MDKILQAKSWLIFLVSSLIPFLIFTSGFLVPAYMYSGAYLFFAFPLAVVLSQLMVYLWLYSVGSSLYLKYGLHNMFSNASFKFFVAVPVLMLLIILFFWIWGASILGSGKFSMANVLMSALWYLIPIQILFVISKFYCFYFAAKVIKSIEKKQEASFDDLLPYFILLIVFPIGIWKVQSKVNELCLKE